MVGRMEKLLCFPTAVPHDPAIAAWLAAQPASLGALAGAALGAIWAARYTRSISGRSPVSVS